MDKLVALKEKMSHLDDLIEERDEAFDEYKRDVEKNKSHFMSEVLYEVQTQIMNDLRNEKIKPVENEIDDRIDDIFESKCRSLKSYERYSRIRREVSLISRMLMMQKEM